MNAVQRDFLEAMLKLYKEGKATDAFILCQGNRKPVHTAVLVARCFTALVSSKFDSMSQVFIL